MIRKSTQKRHADEDVDAEHAAIALEELADPGGEARHRPGYSSSERAPEGKATAFIGSKATIDLGPDMSALGGALVDERGAKLGATGMGQLQMHVRTLEFLAGDGGADGRLGRRAVGVDVERLGADEDDGLGAGLQRAAGGGGDPAGEPADAGLDQRHAVADRVDAAGQRIVLADEGGDEGGCRVVVDRPPVADLLDHPLAHHRDVVGHGERLALVVGDVDEGEADPALDGAKLGAHVLPQLEVERGEGFVEQQHRGLGAKGSGDRDPLPLAAGELVHQLVALALERDQ